MDYLTLFGDSDRFSGGLFTLVAYRDGGHDIRFFSGADYMMVFCLQGSIRFRMKYEQSTLEAGQLVVVRGSKIEHCACLPGTVLFKYAIMDRLSEYMDKCTKAFQTDMLSPIHILPPLAVWLDNFIRQLIRDSDEPEHSYAMQRRELARLLLAYPHRQLEEIFAPLFACSRQCEFTGTCIFHDYEPGEKNESVAVAELNVHGL